MLISQMSLGQFVLGNATQETRCRNHAATVESQFYTLFQTIEPSRQKVLVLTSGLPGSASCHIVRVLTPYNFTRRPAELFLEAAKREDIDR